MRILEVIDRLSGGGAEKNLTTRLRYLGDSDECRILARKLGDLPEYENAQITFREISITRLSQLRLEINSFRPEVIVVHRPSDLVRVCLMKAKFEFILVSFCHNSILSDNPLKHFALRMPVRIANLRVELAIAVSEEARRGPWASGAKRAITIHLGGDRSTFGSQLDGRREANAPVVAVLAGRFTRAKRFEQAIRILESRHQDLLPHEFQLIVVGEGAQERRIRKAITKSHLNVELVNWLPNLDSIFRQADILLVASKNEGGPIVLFECLLAGARFVSTDVGVASDLANIDTESFVVPKDDLALWGDSVVKLVKRGKLPLKSRVERSRLFSDLDVQKSSLEFYQIIRSLTFERGEM